MTSTTGEIAQILLHCEDNLSAPPYVYSEPLETTDINQSIGAIVSFSSEGGDIFVVSDLHLAAGKGRDGRYDGCENFFCDASFHRFLHYGRGLAKRARPILIINGDFIDFLRVTYVPGRPGGLGKLDRALTQFKIRRRSSRLRSQTPEEKEEFDRDFIEWRKILEKIGIHRNVEDLSSSITDKEELYGLKTHDFKSVLRLDVVIRGHVEFFDALADWLESGGRLVMVKGNHDLEWYWLAVRNYLRLDLAQRIADRHADGNLEDVLLKTVLPNLYYIDHAMVIDGHVYIEHGHPYDPLTRVIGEETVNKGQELNIPFGSFFNRYVLNLVELDYPYIDNIRPTPNILPLMLRQNFFAGLRMLYHHLSVIVKTVPRRYVGYIFGQHLIGRVLLILLLIIAPPIILINHQVTTPTSVPLILVEWVALLAAIYAAVQALTYFQLKEPDSLASFARLRMAENPHYDLLTFGHTHNPDQFEERGRWFYNTGTWIPIVETTTSDIREDKTFTFLHLSCDEAGKIKPGVLQRWDDPSGRGGPIVLTRRGDS
jgi:UDP-2,3-diacylglucosamine pyrophosphatase LpxH